MKDRYDVLIFDWDGTLFDSIGWIVACLQPAARESGLAVPSDAETSGSAVTGWRWRPARRARGWIGRCGKPE